MLTLPGFLILVAICFIVLWLFVVLGSLPGKTAVKRNHPQAEAINVLGWLGMLFGGVGWIVAMVWAHMKPVFPVQSPEPLATAPADDAAPRNIERNRS